MLLGCSTYSPLPLPLMRCHSLVDNLQNLLETFVGSNLQCDKVFLNHYLNHYLN